MSNEFKGRCFIIGDDVLELQVFDGKLRPMSSVQRSIDEWAEDSLREMDAAWFRDQLGLDDGDYQVVFDGEISGYWSWTDCGNEYDEDVYLTKIESEPVPKEFADSLIDDQ